jgi:hypothetical protein
MKILKVQNAIKRVQELLKQIFTLIKLTNWKAFMTN